jgi:hypothetical protein
LANPRPAKSGRGTNPFKGGLFGKPATLWVWPKSKTRPISNPPFRLQKRFSWIVRPADAQSRPVRPFQPTSESFRPPLGRLCPCWRRRFLGNKATDLALSSRDGSKRRRGPSRRRFETVSRRVSRSVSRQGSSPGAVEKERRDGLPRRRSQGRFESINKAVERADERPSPRPSQTRLEDPLEGRFDDRFDDRLEGRRDGRFETAFSRGPSRGPS